MTLGAVICELCAGPLPTYIGRGRHRKRCIACASDKAAVGRAWRTANAGRVATRNVSRRTIQPEKQCPRCLMAFIPRRKDTLRCADCRRDKRTARGRPRPRSLRARTLRIGDRDGWICWICTREVDPELRYPHKDAPSQDHVLPLSRGGSDDDSNVRLAHFACNIRRRNLDLR